MLNVLVFPYAQRTVVLGLRRKDVSNDQGHRVGTFVTHPSPSNVCSMRKMAGFKLWKESSTNLSHLPPYVPPETHPRQRSTAWDNKKQEQATVSPESTGLISSRHTILGISHSGRLL